MNVYIGNASGVESSKKHMLKSMFPVSVQVFWMAFKMSVIKNFIHLCVTPDNFIVNGEFNGYGF